MVELLVVIVVLGILLGTAGVVAPDDREDSLDLFTIQVLDAVSYARSLAVATRIPHGVAFDPAGERLAVVAQGGQVSADPLTHGAYVIDFQGVNQPSRLDLLAAAFGAAGTSAVFDGQGVPLRGGTVTLGCSGLTRVLVLDAATGQMD